MDAPSESTLFPDAKPSLEQQNASASTPSTQTSILSPTSKWAPTSRIYVVFLTMCVITLTAALDATSLSVALPVSPPPPPPANSVVDSTARLIIPRSSLRSCMAVQSRPSGPAPPSSSPPPSFSPTLPPSRTSLAARHSSSSRWSSSRLAPLLPASQTTSP